MPDTKRSRMVFTAEELKNEQLEDIQKESWSWLRKEFFMEMEQFFNQNDSLFEVKATANDLKKHFFQHNHQVTNAYLFKILRDEMLLKQEKLQRYKPLDSDSPTPSRGRPFTFKRSDFQIGELEKVEIEAAPF